jgi:hypothetical protein
VVEVPDDSVAAREGVARSSEYDTPAATAAIAASASAIATGTYRRLGSDDAIALVSFSM